MIEFAICIDIFFSGWPVDFGKKEVQSKINGIMFIIFIYNVNKLRYFVFNNTEVLIPKKKYLVVNEQNISRCMM